MTGVMVWCVNFLAINCCEHLERFTADENGWTRMHADQLNDISRDVIGRAFVVLNTLGSGFLEKVYENALAHELRKAGMAVEQQYGLTVMYDGIVVGKYVADIMVEDCLLVEIKVAKTLDELHAAQCISYLKASGLPLCLLLNFARPRLEIKRLVNGL